MGQWLSRAEKVKFPLSSSVTSSDLVSDGLTNLEKICNDSGKTQNTFTFIHIIIPFELLSL